MGSTSDGTTRTSDDVDADQVEADRNDPDDEPRRSDSPTGTDGSSGTGDAARSDSSPGADILEEGEGTRALQGPAATGLEDLKRGGERHHVLMHTPLGGLYVVAAEDRVVGIYHEDHDPPPGPVRLGQPLHTSDGSLEDEVSRTEAEAKAGAGAGAEAAASTTAAAAVSTSTTAPAAASEASAGTTDVLDRACQELTEYFEGRRRHFSFPLRVTGTAFQEDVWRVLAEIPFGERRSYRDVAGSLGNPAMGRAIGAAVRANPLSIAIPGHRVVSSSGKVVGYAAGVGVKSALLDFEQSLGVPLEHTDANASDFSAVLAASHARATSQDVPPRSDQE